MQAESRQAIKTNVKAPLYGAMFCDPDWIRTNDPQLRRLMLYPTELPDQF